LPLQPFSCRSNAKVRWARIFDFPCRSFARATSVTGPLGNLKCVFPSFFALPCLRHRQKYIQHFWATAACTARKALLLAVESVHAEGKMTFVTSSSCLLSLPPQGTKAKRLPLTVQPGNRRGTDTDFSPLAPGEKSVKRISLHFFILIRIFQ
jgi:hypothetical protein